VNIDSETRLSGELDSIAKLPILFSGLRARMEKLSIGYLLIEDIKNFEIFELESDSMKNSLNLIRKKLSNYEFPINYNFSVTCPSIDDYDY
jgi:hypothetical protein